MSNLQDQTQSSVPLSAIAGRRQRNRIDSTYAARELCEQALREAGCADVPAAWSATIALAETRLAGFMVALSLEAAGLAPTPAPATSTSDQPSTVRTDNTSGHVGIDWHRGRWRARCWKAGKVVFNRSHVEIQRAIDARARYLRDNP